jgi:hypothetical protein
LNFQDINACDLFTLAILAALGQAAGLGLASHVLQAVVLVKFHYKIRMLFWIQFG